MVVGYCYSFLFPLTITVLPLLTIPLLGISGLISVVFFFPQFSFFYFLQKITLNITYVLFLWSLVLVFFFNNSMSGYQFISEFPIGYFFAVDSLSIYFIVLVTAIFP